MQIEMRPICSIRPYDNNPRINDGAVDAVAKSLTEFGWRQPIVVDSDGVIAVGHTRYKAALPPAGGDRPPPARELRQLPPSGGLVRRVRHPARVPGAPAQAAVGR